MSNRDFGFEQKSKQSSITSPQRVEKERKQEHFLEYYYLVPDYLKVWPYDIVLVYCPNDGENVRLYLQNLSSIKLREKHKIRAILFDNPKISFFSETMRLSSFGFLYVTKDFCENPNGWNHFSKQTWISYLIYNKKCVVINFYGKKLPMGLNSLASINGIENFTTHSKRIYKFLENHVERRIQIENKCREEIYQWIKCNVLQNPKFTNQGRSPKTKTIVDRNGDERLLDNEINIKRKDDDERKIQVVKPQARSVSPRPQGPQNTQSLHSDGVSCPCNLTGEYPSVDNSLEIDGSDGLRTDEYTVNDSRTEPVIIHHHYHHHDMVINIYKDEQEKLQIESRNRAAKSSRRNDNRSKSNLSHQKNSVQQQILSDFQIRKPEKDSFGILGCFPSLETIGDILSNEELESRESCLYNDTSLDGEIISRNDGHHGCQKIGDRRNGRLHDCNLESETLSQKNDHNSYNEALTRNEGCQKADDKIGLGYKRQNKNSDHEFGTHTNKVNLQNTEEQTRDLEMSKQPTHQTNVQCMGLSQTTDLNIGHGTTKQNEKLCLHKEDHIICDKEMLKQTEQPLNMNQDPSPNLDRFLDIFLPNRSSRPEGNGHFLVQSEIGHNRDSHTVKEHDNICDSNEAHGPSDSEEEIVNFFDI